MRTETDRVLKLALCYPEGISPKVLASKLKIPHASARVILRRLEERRLLSRVQRGYYGPVNHELLMGNPPPLELRFHGIKLELRLECNSIRAWLSSAQSLDVTLHRHATNGGITLTRSFRSRDVTITAHERAGEIEVFIGGTMRPLDLVDVLAYVDWLGAVLWPINVLQGKITQLGMNYDIRGLRIDGDHVVTLHELNSFVLRLYGKGDLGLRCEAHVQTNISLEHALDALRSAAERITGPPTRKARQRQGGPPKWQQSKGNTQEDR